MPARILVINPNSSAAVTAAIDAAMAPLRIAGGPEISVAGLASGPPGIATQRDADSVVTPLVEWVGRDPSDAFVLACFSDPGLHAVREALKAAGYAGEKVVVLVPANSTAQKPLGDVAVDMFQRAGMNVEYAGMDFGSVLQRQQKNDPASAGGWSAGAGNWQGIDCLNPAGHPLLPADGSVAGWYRSDRMDALRDSWLQAPTPAEQQRICGEIQALAWDEVPFLPLGEYKQPTSYRKAITGVLDGTAVFWNVRPA